MSFGFRSTSPNSNATGIRSNKLLRTPSLHQPTQVMKQFSHTGTFSRSIQNVNYSPNPSAFSSTIQNGSRKEQYDDASLTVDRLNFTANRFIRAADKIKQLAQTRISGVQLEYDMLTYESEKVALQHSLNGICLIRNQINSQFRSRSPSLKSLEITSQIQSQYQTEQTLMTIQRENNQLKNQLLDLENELANLVSIQQKNNRNSQLSIELQQVKQEYHFSVQEKNLEIQQLIETIEQLQQKSIENDFDSKYPRKAVLDMIICIEQNDSSKKMNNYIQLAEKQSKLLKMIELNAHVSTERKRSLQQMIQFLDTELKDILQYFADLISGRNDISIIIDSQNSSKQSVDLNIENKQKQSRESQEIKIVKKKSSSQHVKPNETKKDVQDIKKRLIEQLQKQNEEKGYQISQQAYLRHFIEMLQEIQLEVEFPNIKNISKDENRIVSLFRSEFSKIVKSQASLIHQISKLQSQTKNDQSNESTIKQKIQVQTESKDNLGEKQKYHSQQGEDDLMQTNHKIQQLRDAHSMNEKQDKSKTSINDQLKQFNENLYIILSRNSIISSNSIEKKEIQLQQMLEQLENYLQKISQDHQIQKALQNTIEELELNLSDSIQRSQRLQMQIVNLTEKNEQLQREQVSKIQEDEKTVYKKDSNIIPNSCQRQYPLENRWASLEEDQRRLIARIGLIESESQEEELNLKKYGDEFERKNKDENEDSQKQLNELEEKLEHLQQLLEESGQKEIEFVKIDAAQKQEIYQLSQKIQVLQIQIDQQVQMAKHPETSALKVEISNNFDLLEQQELDNSRKCDELVERKDFEFEQMKECQKVQTLINNPNQETCEKIIILSNDETQQLHQEQVLNNRQFMIGNSNLLTLSIRCSKFLEGVIFELSRINQRFQLKNINELNDLKQLIQDLKLTYDEVEGSEIKQIDNEEQIEDEQIKRAAKKQTKEQKVIYQAPENISEIQNEDTSSMLIPPQLSVMKESNQLEELVENHTDEQQHVFKEEDFLTYGNQSEFQDQSQISIMDLEKQKELNPIIEENLALKEQIEKMFIDLNWYAEQISQMKNEKDEQKQNHLQKEEQGEEQINEFEREEEQLVVVLRNQLADEHEKHESEMIESNQQIIRLQEKELQLNKELKQALKSYEMIVTANNELVAENEELDQQIQKMESKINELELNQGEQSNNDADLISNLQEQINKLEQKCKRQDEDISYQMSVINKLKMEEIEKNNEGDKLETVTGDIEKGINGIEGNAQTISIQQLQLDLSQIKYFSEQLEQILVATISQTIEKELDQNILIQSCGKVLANKLLSLQKQCLEFIEEGSQKYIGSIHPSPQLSKPASEDLDKNGKEIRKVDNYSNNQSQQQNNEQQSIHPSNHGMSQQDIDRLTKENSELKEIKNKYASRQEEMKEQISGKDSMLSALEISNRELKKEVRSLKEATEAVSQKNHLKTIFINFLVSLPDKKKQLETENYLNIILSMLGISEIEKEEQIIAKLAPKPSDRKKPIALLLLRK